MSVISDPLITPLDVRPESAPWLASERRPLVRVPRAVPSTRPSRGATLFARTLVIGAAVMLTLRVVGSWLAEPLVQLPGVSPMWNVEVASTSSSSMLALAYSSESGVHLLRVPGSDGVHAPRVIPARIAAGDLHLLSLGFGRLDVQGRGPNGSRLVSYTAKARAVTVYDRPTGTGVRTRW